MNGRRSRCREARSGETGTAPGRRQFLVALAAGGAGLVAGCADDYDADEARWPGDTEDAWRTSFHGEIDATNVVRPDRRIRQVAFDVGFVTTRSTDDRLFVLADEVEESATSVSLTLKPGLEWSNGDPLTGAGVGRWIYMYRTGARNFAPVPEIRDGNRRPRSAWEAITDVHWDDRSVTVEGEFERGPSPLYELNDHLGNHPSRYYERLWEAFRDAFDDEPWEDETTQEAVSTLIEENIWSPGPDYRPEAGIEFEADSEDRGEEAAFSGLWYPYRIRDGLVFFTVNDAHPFADRVSFDEMVWAFRGEQNTTMGDLRSGTIDGAVLRDVTEHVIQSLPPQFDSFEGRPHDVTALTVNHSLSRFGKRDVRAALAYAIDRERLVDDIDLMSRRRVDVPGADLQSEQWVTPDLRDALRPYDHRPDRAKTLLEESGFRRSDGNWYTPEGERFELELLTTERDPTLHHAIVGQLREFGIEANPHQVEGASYQSQRRDGQFLATDTTWSSPNAAGQPDTRTGAYVRPIVAGEGVPDSSYLEREVETAVEASDDLHWVDREDREMDVYDHRYLGFDSVEALRSVTVRAPPYADPDGPLQDWPYLYHALRARLESDITAKVEHARRCTWIYNYQVPELELLIEVPRIFHDTDRWAVPERGDPAWQYVSTGGQPGDLWAALAWGHIDRAR